jgi:hypothetical protein
VSSWLAGATAADRVTENGRYTHPEKKKEAVSLIKAHNSKLGRTSRVQHDGALPPPALPA